MQPRWIAVPAILFGSFVLTAATVTAVTSPTTRPVQIARGGYWLDPQGGRWRPTAPFVSPRVSSNYSDYHFALTPNGQAVFWGGQDGKRPAPPEVFDPEHATWSVFHGTPSEPTPAPLPEGPVPGSTVVSCGQGCALALPTSDSPPGDDPHRRQIYLHNGSWSPFGFSMHAFETAHAATLSDGRIALMGQGSAFGADNFDGRRVLMASRRDAPSWVPLPNPDMMDPTRLIALSDGSLLACNDYSDVRRLRAGATSWEPINLPHDIELGTVGLEHQPLVLPQGRAVMVVTSSEQRTDVGLLLVKIGAAALALATLIGGILGLRKLKPGALPIAVGIMLSVVVQIALLVGVVLIALQGMHGRPLRVEGKILRARIRRRDETPDGPTPETHELGWRDRAWLTLHWASDALLECASVPAFYGLSAKLRALGAPASLSDRADAAAAEESTHTQECLALASAYAGVSLAAEAPVVKPQALAVSRVCALTELATESLEDGCLGEGYSAASAREALHDVTDPAVRAVLSRIAQDEASHAALAWDVLDWCMREGGAPVREAVQNKLNELTRANGVAPPRSRAGSASRQGHGRLHERSPGALWRRVMTEVLREASAQVEGS